jgi:hypothetical protein
MNATESFKQASNCVALERGRSRVADHQRQIGTLEMQRGIYIDFEGIPTRPPSMMGVLYEGTMQQIVFDKDLSTTADANPNLTYQGLAAALVDLQHKALTEGRCIIAYSQHERNKALDFTGVDLSSSYKDARAIARRWKNRVLRLNDPSIRSLKDYADLIGLRYPEGCLKMAARSLQNVKKSIEEYGHFQKCPLEIKAEWRRLLHYNRLDCIWMRELLHAATTKESLETLLN